VFPHYDPIGLVYSIHDSTEVANQKMIMEKNEEPLGQIRAVKVMMYE